MMWKHNTGNVQFFAHTYFDQQWLEGYQSYIESDPQSDPYRVVALRPTNLNSVILCNDLVPEAMFKRTPLFNEHIKRLGDDTVFCTGVGIRSAWGDGVIGTHRGASASPFEEADAKRLGRLLPHMERVLRARGELAAASALSGIAQASLDAVRSAAITLNGNRTVLHHNAAAASVFRRSDGLMMRGGCLFADGHANDTRLSQAIALATARSNPVASALVVERVPSLLPYLLTVTPLIGRSPGNLALVLFRDPESVEDSLEEVLRILFSLTAAEAAVAADLSNGQTLSEIALRRGVSVSTLRSQLKSIFQKSNCSRQSELVALIRRVVG